jgi:5-methyltetrahydropteroyltriglutamate--homocysteine methyltransferase
MRRGWDRIITTHVGSLSRPAELLTLNKARAGGGADVAAYATGLAAAVTDVVNKQRDIGIDIPNDGEFGKPMSATYDYGAWWNYAFERLDGFAAPDSIPESEHKKSTVAELSLTSFAGRRDWQKFNEFYQDPMSGLAGSAPVRRTRRPVCIGPIRYKGHAQTQADIANLKRAMAAAGIEEGFMTSVAPASFARGEDLHYKSEEEFVVATAEAMREEYRAIVDAGLVLQIDDPSLPDNWDMIDPEPPLEEFKKFCRMRIDALNHALSGLPEDRIRYHICWGSWHGPHTTDIPLADIIDLVLAVRAQAYSVEAGNVRHEHEWRVWKEVKLPENKILIPGVVSHATNVVEHPRLVADRIMRFAQIVGRENVIASTDCGRGDA